MLISRNVRTCQVQTFPTAMGAVGSMWPHQPGEGTAGISKMDNPECPALVASSIIYKEHDVQQWDPIHNAFLMPL